VVELTGAVGGGEDRDVTDLSVQFVLGAHLGVAVAVGGGCGLTMPQVVAGSFRWDDKARSAAALPMPFVSDESIVAYWADTAHSGPSLAAPIAGVLADTASTHLLATSAAGGDGELEPTLIRAPAAAVRFERYRHLKRRNATALEVAHPTSEAGALVGSSPHKGARPPLTERSS